MVTYTMAAAFWLRRRFSAAVVWVAAGALFGWPFAAALGYGFGRGL